MQSGVAVEDPPQLDAVPASRQLAAVDQSLCKIVVGDAGHAVAHRCHLDLGVTDVSRGELSGRPVEQRHDVGTGGDESVHRRVDVDEAAEVAEGVEAPQLVAISRDATARMAAGQCADGVQRSRTDQVQPLTSRQATALHGGRATPGGQVPRRGVWAAIG
jgi:hypothetical protein